MATFSNNAFAALNDSDSDNEGPAKPVQTSKKKEGQLSKSAARRAKKKETKNKTQLNTSAVANKGAFNAQSSVNREDTKRSKDTAQKKAGGGECWGEEFGVVGLGSTVWREEGVVAVAQRRRWRRRRRRRRWGRL